MKRLMIHVPSREELGYRKQLLADKETMAFNEPWGGAIDFDKSKWDDWYSRWIENPERFYAYLVEIETSMPIGEIGYRYDEEFNAHMTNIIIDAKHRGKGYGKEGLQLLIDYAFKVGGINKLKDNISIYSKEAHKLFEALGFERIKEIEEYVLFELSKKG